MTPYRTAAERVEDVVEKVKKPLGKVAKLHILVYAAAAIVLGTWWAVRGASWETVAILVTIAVCAEALFLFALIMEDVL